MILLEKLFVLETRLFTVEEPDVDDSRDGDTEVDNDCSPLDETDAELDNALEPETAAGDTEEIIDKLGCKDSETPADRVANSVELANTLAVEDIDDEPLGDVTLDADVVSDEELLVDAVAIIDTDDMADSENEAAVDGDAAAVKDLEGKGVGDDDEEKLLVTLCLVLIDSVTLFFNEKVVTIVLVIE